MVMKLTFVTDDGETVERRTLPGDNVNYAIGFAKQLLRNEEVALGVSDAAPVAGFTVQNAEGATIYDSRGRGP